MKKIGIKFIVESALIAALYVALTWIFAPISYGAIQFRISEVLLLLVILNPKYVYALIIGCFVANMTSSLGAYDMFFGTLATTLAIIPMTRIKRCEVACLFPVISNAFIIAVELGLAFDMFAPEVFWFNVLTVGFGEAVVLYFIGIPMLCSIIKNTKLCEIMDFDNSDVKTMIKYSKTQGISFMLGALLIVFYFAYPIGENVRAFDLTINYLWLVILPIIGGCMIIQSFIFNGKLNYYSNLILLGIYSVMYVLIGVLAEETIVYKYYYGYILVILVMLLINVYGLKILNKRDE